MSNKTFLTPIKFSENSVNYIRKYDGKSNKIWNSSDEEITKIRVELRKHYIPQQNNLCSYCRMENTQNHGLTWDVEHIAPQGDFPRFLFEPRNLALSCKDCNGAKNSKEVVDKKRINASVDYPTNGEFFYIIHPHFDNYDEHIKIERCGDKYIYHPSEGKGLNTYKICNLSRFLIYSTCNITDENLSRALTQRFLELSEEGKITISKEDVQTVGSDLIANPLVVEMSTAFKQQNRE